MLLQVSNVSKEFISKKKKVIAVNNVSIQINSKEFISIIGHSGSGKSTLLHLITGILKPTTGNIMIDRRNIDDYKEKELAELRNQKIGYILQEQNLLKNFTVIENVCMPSFIAHRYEKTIYKKAEQLLEEVGILNIKNSYPNEISGGEARRVAIARALINHPSIIVADEPTCNLDPENSEIIMKLFQSICKTGVTVLISTHNLDYLNYADRYCSMDNGILRNMSK